MIDLNNTKCIATKENLDKLKEFNLKKEDYIDNSLKFNAYLYIENNILKWGHKNCVGAMYDKNYWNKYKEIYLVSGEFQYVETKHKNNFKDYGFEADFEGEILKEVKELKSIEYLGYFVGDNKTHYPCIWTKSGRIWKTSVSEKDRELYNLKPIKKEWYENPDNFPCVIISLKTNKPHIAYNYNHLEEKIKQEQFSSSPDKFRPATKEEVLSLLVKEE